MYNIHIHTGDKLHDFISKSSNGPVLGVFLESVLVLQFITKRSFYLLLSVISASCWKCLFIIFIYIWEKTVETTSQLIVFINLFINLGKIVIKSMRPLLPRISLRWYLHCSELRKKALFKCINLMLSAFLTCQTQQYSHHHLPCCGN